MTGNDPSLPGMSDIEVLDILKIMGEGMDTHIKAECSTPKQCRHPMALAAKQTKSNRSRWIVCM